MGTTVRNAGVMTGVARMADVARMLKEQLLQARRVYLKGRAPRSRYVHQLQREISAERAKPIDMLLQISYANIEDGLSAAVVTQWARSFIAEIEAYEASRRRERPVVGPLLPKMLRETRAQAALDEAQQAALANPDDPAVMDRLIAASAAYDAEQDAMIMDVRGRRARMTSSGAFLTVKC